ncbi:outer membrane protein assembly factor BamB family protein [Alienimonas californiensis]|uniref:Outer membrane biogenesis protein BamB n=1 Tax=Alienimonas californiensis TaxID=2527989 RepID=A0A517PDJ9_9PLAN|nr:PQQ-binding-like beta-propeller repeat protein [Alienimonas californiensis]QDT17463.1 outer membrane biogenesis protein BamB [Alienimonas californiensis]
MFPTSRPLSAVALSMIFSLGCGPGGEPVAPVSVDETGGPVAPSEGAAVDVAARPFDPAAPAVPTAEMGWPQFRGPNRIGIGVGTNPPIEWSDEKNVRWVADVPGRGNSSPVVSGDRVFLTSADEETQTQLLLAYDLNSGEPLWQREVATGSLPLRQMHNEGTHASTTPAVGDGVVFVSQLHDGALWASAWTVDGERLWGEERVGAFEMKHGYGASPVLYGSVVIVAGDNLGPGYLVALDRETGQVRWRTPREPQDTYGTPLIATLNGQDTLVMAGNGALDAYDPADGSLLWSVDGVTETVAGSPVCGMATVDGEQRPVVLASGGYPGSETLAVFPPRDGETEPTVAWRNRDKAYVPSPLILGDFVYMTGDDGRSWCYDAGNGDVMWQTRIPKPLFRASPVAVGTGDDLRILQTSVAGVTTVYRATPDSFEKLAENQLGEESYASPAVVGDALLIRSASGRGADRQDRLYCIAAE